MKKLSIVSLLIVVFSVTAVAANAKPSAPFYLVSMGQPCRLPDGVARPQETTLDGDLRGLRGLCAREGGASG